MEDLSISMVRTGTEAIRPTQTADTTSKAAETLKEQNKDDSSRKERIQEVLKDVIAVSKDGDTAQASKISQDKLKETEEIGDVKELKTKQDAGPSPAERAIEDAEKADAIFTKLMGDEAELRKNFIQSRAATVDLDDLDF